MLGHTFFFFSSRRRHTRYIGDWSSDVCSSDLGLGPRRPRRASEVVESREITQGGTMEHRTLGHSSLSVSALGLGCMSMSGTYGKGDDAQSIGGVQHALGVGVNLLDSADMYGFGHNAELVD